METTQNKIIEDLYYSLTNETLINNGWASLPEMEEKLISENDDKFYKKLADCQLLSLVLTKLIK